MSRRIALAAFWLLLLLEWLWPIWLAPAVHAPLWLPLLVFAVPLTLPAVGLLLRRPNMLFWGALASLLPFCRGVSELWTDPAVTLLASIEIALALLLVLAVGADGLRRRRLARAAASQ